jgi:hypothetical protein
MFKVGSIIHWEQNIVKSTATMLNPKTIDNTGMGYLEFNGAAPH